MYIQIFQGIPSNIFTASYGTTVDFDKVLKRFKLKLTITTTEYYMTTITWLSTKTAMLSFSIFKYILYNKYSFKLFIFMNQNLEIELKVFYEIIVMINEYFT